MGRRLDLELKKHQRDVVALMDKIRLGYSHWKERSINGVSGVGRDQ